jgi:hypothetical protein
MQKPKVGSVIILTTEIDPPNGITKGSLGVVLSVVEDKKSWGIKELTVDFGCKNGKLLKYNIDDMSYIQPYEMPKKAPKDSIGKDVAEKI